MRSGSRQLIHRKGSNDSGFWTQRDCLESLRDYLATQPPAMFVPSLGLVASA